MTYQASLEFLYGLQKHGIKLGLETIQAILARLGDPQRCYQTLHIGGTNGKGSTAAMTAAILQAAGYRVALYTSPHLVDFRERIRINGQPISESAVTALTEQIRGVAGASIRPTFFEFTTALAFQYFAEMHIDVAVVEVGMGGRFDATNVLTPLVATITNVALDHQAYLGETIDAIAFEKAGIIKAGVPVVVGRLSREASVVIDRIAGQRRASCYRLNSEFKVRGETVAGFHYEGLERSYRDLTCPLLGDHQLDNAACALAMLELASGRGLPVSEAAVRSGLGRVQWEGRLEIVEHRPLLLLDGAHNPAAAEVVAAYLRQHRRAHPRSRIILVVGMLRDKDRETFLRTVLPVVDEVIVTQVRLARSATIGELRDALGPWAVAARAVPISAEALTLARQLAGPDDLICVTGSLMLVGEVKALLRGCEVSPLHG